MSAGQLISGLLCMLIIAAAIFFPIYYLSDKDTQDKFKNTTGLAIPELPPSLQDLPDSLRDQIPESLQVHEEDPYHMLEPGEANTWESDGSGLNLEVVNALDPQWYDYFDEAVIDWDQGDPDALTLTTSTADSDSECAEIEGLQKVCNGDYGETDWKGINQVLLYGSTITSSTARMNDHFFTEGGDDAKRLYTMCHEM